MAYQPFLKIPEINTRMREYQIIWFYYHIPHFLTTGPQRWREASSAAEPRSIRPVKQTGLNYDGFTQHSIAWGIKGKKYGREHNKLCRVNGLLKNYLENVLNLVLAASLTLIVVNFLF